MSIQVEKLNLTNDCLEYDNVQNPH